MATATVPIRTSAYWHHAPSVKQAAFLSLPHEEALYGGAAGGGKSDALLMASLQYVDVPGYAAIIIRRTFKQLTQPDMLIPRSHEWLGPTDARWNEQEHEWLFPSGALLKFGYLDSQRDLDNYQGAAYQFIGWDELTQFPLEHYTYVSFSRNRRRVDVRVPIRIRGASNPGGRSHDAVKERFGIYSPEGDDDRRQLCQRPEWISEHGRVFIPAKVQDNPGLDVEDYVGRMQHLDHHTRAQLLEGDWDDRPPGDLFRREWFEVVDRAPEGCRWVRFWDLAATEPSDANPDPDWTAGLRMGRHPNGHFFIEHVERLRKRPQGVEAAVTAMSERDGVGTKVHIEQEPGSSGKNTVDSYQRLLSQRAVEGTRSTGSKAERARVVSAKAEHGLIKLVRGTWNTPFLDEVEAFTETDDHAHDDQVDALSGAYAVLAKRAGAATESRLPTGKPKEVVRGDLVLVGDRFVDQK